MFPYCIYLVGDTRPSSLSCRCSCELAPMSTLARCSDYLGCLDETVRPEKVKLLGALVKYRPLPRMIVNPPAALGIVVDEKSHDSEFHHRIRVMWCAEELPIQAQACSIDGARVTTWLRPQDFIVLD